MLRLYIFSLSSLLSFTARAQVADSLIRKDNFITDDHSKNNPTKNTPWGNSWYIGAAYNRNDLDEFDFNIGRAWVTKTRYYIIMKSWGLGYGLSNKNRQSKDLVKLFGEFSSFIGFPLVDITGRAEYLYDINDKKHYLRPYIGFNILYVDLLYHYSIPLNGMNNDFRHGLTIRLKYFLKN